MSAPGNLRVTPADVNGLRIVSMRPTGVSAAAERAIAISSY